MAARSGSRVDQRLFFLHCKVCHFLVSLTWFGFILELELICHGHRPLLYGAPLRIEQAVSQF